LKNKNTTSITEKIRLNKILLRPEIELSDILEIPRHNTELLQYNKDSLERASIEIKYQAYIERENETAQKIIRLEDLKIPNNFDYSKMESISMEGREKLKKIKPETIGQAKRISGVSASDIQVLLIHFGR
jgi:tRNA uridine 5-carboxymethylaminomethyl modification enzyme